MSDEMQDNVTALGEQPDMAALQQAWDDAWAQDQYLNTRLAYLERIRYARWSGQHESGLLNTEYLAGCGLKNPLYDGAPDTRILLVDDVINYGVDLFVTAFANAQIKTSPVAGRTLNAAQAGELFTLLNWLKHGPLKAALTENVEIAAQFTWMIGWCVLHPTWRNSKLMKMQRLTMQEIFQTEQAAALAAKQKGTPKTLLAHMSELILDATLEDAAVELLQQLFPDLDKREARRVVRELRTEQEAEFPVEEESSIGPELAVLCPWLNFIMPQEATARPADARVMFVRMQIPKWRVDQLAADEEWDDAEFIRLLKESAGTAQREPATKEDDRDINRNLCELGYAFRMVTENGKPPAVWCTVMSPQVPGRCGKNWFLNLAHAKMPFVFPRLEAADWCITDTRGVPDMLLTQQAEMKQQRDGVFVQSQLSNTPPIMALGTSASKAMPEMGPFAVVRAPSGKPWEVLNLTAGSKPDLAIKITEMVRKEAEDRFGIPRADTPPERSNLRRQKLVNQWLAVWGEAFHQLAVLAYQNMSDDELTEVLGHKPLLTVDLIKRHQILMQYDVRAGNPEFIDRLIKWLPVARQMDAGGTTDVNKLVRFIYNYIDPSMANELTNDDVGAQQKIFKDVQNEFNSMALGNPPGLVQMDPTAKMQLQFAQQIMQSNPQFALRLAPKLPNGAENPQHDPAFFERVQTWLKNRQHSYQETVLSKQQGLLGVSQVGQGGPVRTGGEN